VWDDFGVPGPSPMAHAKRHSPSRPSSTRNHPSPFAVEQFLDSANISKSSLHFNTSEIIFTQGDPCHSVMYIQAGSVTLSVLSSSGREAIVGMLGVGDFFGEAALTAQCLRLDTATAVAPTSVLVVPKEEMVRLLREKGTFADHFIQFMLHRNIRMEQDLIDQLFNSSEKRLARALLLLARYGNGSEPHATLPRISHETLAEMIGTTRSRVNFFMNKFRKLGFIDYNGHLTIHASLLSIVLHD
jgi:CRP/FNR family transcriptional regulator, cyclic AMP receptor protein